MSSSSRNPIRPIFLTDLTKQKVTAKDPISYIRFRNELKTRIAESTAKRYVGKAILVDGREDWAFQRDFLRAKISAYIEGLRNPVPGVVSPENISPRENLDLKTATDSIKDYNDDLDRETNAFKDIFAYIKSVIQDAEHIKIDGIVTAGAAKRAREVYEDILTHLSTVCLHGIGNLRDQIMLGYDNLGVADTKEELITLIAAAEHWIKMRVDFDVDNPTAQPALTVTDKMKHILQRVMKDGELKDIRKMLDAKSEDASLIWETETKSLRAACKKDTLTIIELYEMSLKAAGEPITTHNMAMAAGGGGVSSSSASAGRDTSFSSAPHSFGQPSAQGGDNEYDRQQQYQQQQFRQPYHQQAFQAQALNQQQYQQPYQQQASQAQASDSQQHQQPYQQQAFQAQASDSQQYQQQYQQQAFQAQAPIRQQSQQQVFLSAPQGQGNSTSYSGMPYQSSGSAAARDVPECFAYPYCNFNAQGCRYRHVTRQGESKADNDRDQEWHDKERAQGRPGGPRTGVGRPGSLIRQREQSGGGTPARDNKFSRYDAR